MINSQAPENIILNCRTGATLSEVLISLLVMSVGVVSVAALFPISVLRSVQASQLTNAANLRYNVEALLSVRPEIVSVAQSWRPSTVYGANSLVSPLPLTSLKLPPVVFYPSFVPPATSGTSGTREPNWVLAQGQTTPDSASLEWRAVLLKNYVIDPLGEVLVESSYRNTTDGDFFGNTAPGSPWSGLVSGWPGVRAFTGFGYLPSEAAADDIACLPDSWVSQAISDKVSYVAGDSSCDISGTENTVGAYSAASAYLQYRITLFDDSGRFSEVRPVYSIVANGNDTWTIRWQPTIAGSPTYGPLPTGFLPKRVVLESKERRYSWILSVRRGFSGTANMDVVIFFRRPFSGKDEQVYPATFTKITDFGLDGVPGRKNVDDDGNSIVDVNASGVPDAAEIGYPGSDDIERNWVVVQYDAQGEPPFAKKGGFVTDVDTLRWYRIIDVIQATNTSAAFTSAGIALSSLNQPPSSLAPYQPIYPYLPDGATYTNTAYLFLRLESPIAESGPQPVHPGDVPVGKAMFMRGIVDVYPIRAQMSWDN